MSETPEIDGLIPGKVVTKLGSYELERIGPKVIHGDDRLVLVVEVRPAAINHPLDEDGEPKERIQSLRIVDAYELDGDEGRDVLRKVRNAWMAADNSARGVMPFDDTVPAAQYTSSDGTVMTPAEVRAQRGESWDPGDELLVVFADGTKAAWPEDWAGTGQSLAPVGGEMRLPDGDPGEVGQVVKLVDPVSGDAVAEWTDADEEARELATAAKEDREAMAELEAARAAARADEEDED